MPVPDPVSSTSPCANPVFQGYGSGTTGGQGKPVYRVTHLRDDGSAGSLRAALGGGNRCIIFDVGGEIVLRSQLYARNAAFVTIDGFTAPSPGITIKDYGLAFWGQDGSHDVIIRGIRIRDAGTKSCAAGGTCYDGIQIKEGAFNMVIDHVSSNNAADGAIDVGHNTHDILIQYSIISGTANQSLFQRALRNTMHHNLFINGKNRNPQVNYDNAPTPAAPDTVMDFRNNLIWNFLAYGTLARPGTSINIVNNFYYQNPTYAAPSAARAIVVDKPPEGYPPQAYTKGNFSLNRMDLNSRGNRATPFPAAALAITDACAAARAVRAGAGARSPRFGLDAVDRAYINQIQESQLSGCP
jgi:hypothetical protein